MDKQKSWDRCQSYKRKEQEQLKKYGNQLEQLNQEYNVVKSKLRIYEERMRRCTVKGESS